MHAHRTALLLLATFATLTLAGGATAQDRYYRQGHGDYGNGPRHGDDGYRHHGHGHFRGPGWSAVVPGIILAIPRRRPPPGPFIDDGSIDEPVDHRHHRHPHRHVRRHRSHRHTAPHRVTRRHSPQRATPRRRPRTARPAPRYVPDEVVVEIAQSAGARQINALQRRFRLVRLEQHHFQLTGTTLIRWRIPDRRSVPSVVRALARDRTVVAAQPNYLFTLQASHKKTAGNSAQYALAKLHLPQAHKLAKGDQVRVALIDTAVDLHNPELAGSIAGSYDLLPKPRKPHKHGTAIAGLIAAHGKLIGAAPDAKLLAVGAFDPGRNGADGTSFNILLGLDWAALHHARIVNMSFAGPSDPALHRALQAAHKKGMVLIAAAGNAGAKSPPLYPAADANVIAVSATDAHDRLFKLSNRGRYIAVAAPGAQVLVAIPGGYEVSSGTSYSAAEVSGVAALLLQRDPGLTPDRLRDLLQKTARDLGPHGRDHEFGAGLVDAYAALNAEHVPVAGVRPSISRVSTDGR